MNTELVERITLHREKAILPWLVQCKNTENWASHSIHENELDAVASALVIKQRYPNLRVRIAHIPNRIGGAA